MRKPNLALTFIGFCERDGFNLFIRWDQDAVGDILIFIEVDEGDACGLHDAHGGGVSVIGGRTCTGEAWTDIFTPDDGIGHFRAILKGDAVIADMELLGFDPIAAIEGDMRHIEVAGMLDGKAVLFQSFLIEMLEHPFCAKKAVFDFLFAVVILIPKGAGNIKEPIIGEGALHGKRIKTSPVGG